MAAPIITDIEINTARSQQSVQKLREEMVSLGVTAERIDFLLANNNNTFLKQISTRDALARGIRQYTAIEEQAAASLKRGETTLAQYNYTLNQGIAAIAANAAKREAMTQAVAKEAASIGGATQAHANYTEGQQKSAAAAQRGTGAIKLQAHELAMLGQQIQDVGVSLAGGQNPFLVIAQQAPQAAYAVGGFSNLYKLAMQSITSPTGLAVIGIGSLAAGMALVGSRVMDLNANSREFGVAIRAMGNDAVVTTAQLQKMVTALKEQGVASDEAKAIVASTARNRNLTGAGMERVTANSPNFAAGYGVSVADAAKQISDMATGGYDAVKKLHEAYGLLTAAEMENIRVLYQSGQSAEAVEKAFAGLEKSIANAARESRSSGANAWIDLKNSLSDLLTEVAKSEPVVMLMERLAGAFKGLAAAIRPVDKATLAAAVKPEVIAELKRNIAIQEADVARLGALQNAGGASPFENLGEELNSAQFKLEAYRKALDDATKSTDGFKEATGQAAAGVGSGEAIAKTGLNTSALNDQAAIIKARAALTGSGAYARAIGEADIKTAQMALEKSYSADELATLAANNRKEATLGLNDALARTARTSRIEAAETLKVADAYKISTAAGQIAAAQRQAAVDAYTTGANVEIRTRQILLDKVREQIDTASAQREANAIEVSNAERLAAAQKIGVGAYVDVELAIKKETETRQARIALQIAEQNGFSEEVNRLKEMIALREQQLELIDKETKASQLAADIRKASQDVEIAGMQEAISKLTDVNERRAASIALARRQQEISLANDPRYANDPEARAALMSKGDQVRALQDNARFYDEVRQQAEGLSKDVSQFLVDGFVNAEKGGKSAFANLWEGALAGAKRFAAQVAAQFLQQRILMPIAMQIVGGSPGSFGVAQPGGSSSGGVGTGDILSLGKSIFEGGSQISSATTPISSGITNQINAIGNSVFGTAAPSAAGGWAVSGVGGPTAASLNAGSNLAAASTLTSYLPYIGAALNTITNFASGNVAGGVGSIAGAGIGTLILPGIGTAIGSTLGSMIGGMFGGKKPSVGPGGGAEFGIGADGKAIIGLTNGDNGYDALAQNTGPANAVGLAAKTLVEKLGGTFKGTAEKDKGGYLGSNTKKGTFSGGDSFGSPETGFNPEVQTLAEAAGAALVGVLKNSIVEGLSKDIGDRLKAVKTAADLDGLLQYVDALTKVHEAYKAWAEPLSTIQVAMQGVKSEFELAKTAATSLSKPISDVTASYEKQIAFIARKFNEPLVDRFLAAIGDNAGLQVVQKEREYSALRKDAAAIGQAAVLQVEKTIAAERSALARASATALAKSAVDALDQTYKGLVAELEAAKQAEVAQLSRQRDLWSEIVKNMQLFRDSLLVGRLSPLDPEAQMREAQKQFSDTLAKAKGGDAEAAGRVSGLAETALEQTQGFYASSEAYAEYFKFVQDQLKGLQDYAGVQQSAADRQLSAMVSTAANTRDTATILKELAEVIRQRGAANVNVVSQQAGNNAKAGEAITKAYNESLGRSPDEAGAAWWAGQVSGGKMTIDQAVAGISGSNEAQVRKAYQDILGRAPDAAGGQFFQSLLAGGSSIDQIRAAIAGSAEAKGRAFADGGLHMGGMRLVGERGPELEVTGPARIWSFEQTRRMMSGGNDNSQLAGLVRTLISRIEHLTLVSADAGDGNNERLDELRSEMNSLTRTLKNSQLVA